MSAVGGPTLTEDPRDVAAWFADRDEGMYGQFWGFGQLSVKSPNIAVDVKLAGPALRFQVRGVEDSEFQLGDQDMTFRLEHAAVWSGGIVMSGDLRMAWRSDEQRRFYTRFRRREYPEDRRNGLWYPDLEFTLPGAGFVHAVPAEPPGLASWLPAAGQYRAQISMLEGLFSVEVGRLDDGERLRDTITAAGTALARVGRRALVLDRIAHLVATSPAAAKLDAWLRFFDDQERAAADFEASAMALAQEQFEARLTLNRPRAERVLRPWLREVELARGYGLL